jgi:energy-coupling factor transporter ATP-binding protein EcfA2
MDNPLIVFVSSVIAGMEAERQAARAAIQAISLTRPWLFEFSSASSLPLQESYLAKVRGCDIFVLLLGDRLTDPVKVEAETARLAGKPLLVFLWEDAPAEVAAFARSLGVKYAPYRDPDALAAAVAEAVGDEVIEGYRGRGLTRADVATVLALLERVAQGGFRVETGGGAFVAGSVFTGGGLFAGHDVIVNPAADPPDALLRAYHRALAEECCRLPLGVIDKEFVHTTGETPVPLPDIYVDLDVVAPAADGKRGSERAWALRLARGEGRDRTPLLDALAGRAAARAVLLGDPGSGKTTFVNYLAYLLAADPDRLSESLRGCLPVRLVLREVAARHIPASAATGTAQMLWDALAADVAGRLGEIGSRRLMPYLQDRLVKEGGFILLDGLDEVPAARERRKGLVEAVQRLADALPKARTRLLVTARPYAYADQAWRLPGFATLALAPFNEAQVDRFVGRWYQAVRGSMQWDADTARDKGARLSAALRERPYLADLASRPRSRRSWGWARSGCETCWRRWRLPSTQGSAVARSGTKARRISPRLTCWSRSSPCSASWRRPTCWITCATGRGCW